MTFYCKSYWFRLIIDLIDKKGLQSTAILRYIVPSNRAFLQFKCSEVQWNPVSGAASTKDLPVLTGNSGVPHGQMDRSSEWNFYLVTVVNFSYTSIFDFQTSLPLMGLFLLSSCPWIYEAAWIGSIPLLASRQHYLCLILISSEMIPQFQTLESELVYLIS